MAIGKALGILNRPGRRDMPAVQAMSDERHFHTLHLACVVPYIVDQLVTL